MPGSCGVPMPRHNRAPVLAADRDGDGMDEYPGSHAGGLIRACRLGAGLTQQQLADTAGVSVGVVRDLEQGRTTRPHAESVRRLASALRLNRQQAGVALREAITVATAQGQATAVDRAEALWCEIRSGGGRAGR